MTLLAIYTLKMENIFEIVTIKSLSDNFIWLLRNNIKNLTAVIDPSDDKDVNEVLLLKNWHLNQIVNTHHHLFQTLTKSVKSSQDSSLFDWLKTLYPIWANINPEQLKSAVKIGLSELILSGLSLIHI